MIVYRGGSTLKCSHMAMSMEFAVDGGGINFIKIRALFQFDNDHQA